MRKIVPNAGWPPALRGSWWGVSSPMFSLSHSEVTPTSFLILKHPTSIPTSSPLECSAPRSSHDWLLPVLWVSAQMASSQEGLSFSPNPTCNLYFLGEVPQKWVLRLGFMGRWFIKDTLPGETSKRLKDMGWDFGRSHAMVWIEAESSLIFIPQQLWCELALKVCLDSLQKSWASCTNQGWLEEGHVDINSQHSQLLHLPMKWFSFPKADLWKESYAEHTLENIYLVQNFQKRKIREFKSRSAFSRSVIQKCSQEQMET